MFRTIALFNFRNKQGGTNFTTYTNLKSNFYKTQNLRTSANPLDLAVGWICWLGGFINVPVSDNILDVYII